jgi:hypothetical protein
VIDNNLKNPSISNMATTKLSKKNFEKNLKMANLEIMRLRKEVQDKNSAFTHLQKAFEEVVNQKDGYSTVINKNKVG